MEILKIIGSAVCHQSPERTLSAFGEGLPLCARCLGIQLGLLCGLLCIALTGRMRASGFPTRAALVPLSVGPVLNLADVTLALIGADSGGNVRRLALGAMLGSSVAYALVPAFARMFAVRRLWAASVDSPLEAIGAITFSTVLTMTIALEGGAIARAAGAVSVLTLSLVLAAANLAVIRAVARPNLRPARLVGLALTFAGGEIAVGSLTRLVLLAHL